MADSAADCSAAALNDCGSESLFPLLLLADELVAGISHRLSEGARFSLESVNSRLAAVTRAHGYIHRHELDIIAVVGAECDRWPAVRVCGFDVDIGAVRAAVVTLLARRRRVSRLALDVSDSSVDLFQFFDDDLQRMREGLVDVIAVLLDSARLRLRTVTINALFARCFGDAATGVALLLRRHAATIAEMEVDCCADVERDVDAHEHAELCQATAACVAMQRFAVSDGHLGCLMPVVRDCLPVFKRLRALHLDFDADFLFDFDALPQPSQLEELRLNCAWTGSLTDAARARPDVFASLRAFAVNHCWADVPVDLLDGLLAYCPRLQKLRVESLFDGDEPSFARSLVAQWFAAEVERHLRVELIVHWLEKEDLAQVAVTVDSFEALCAKLLAGLPAASPPLTIACSDAQVFVMACGAVLDAAIAANAAFAALVGQAFVDFLQTQAADPSVYAATVSAAGALLARGAAMPITGGSGCGGLDYAAVAPFFAAVLSAATTARIQLTTDLSKDRDKHNEVVLQLQLSETQQLDIIVCKKQAAD